MTLMKRNSNESYLQIKVSLSQFSTKKNALSNECFLTSTEPNSNANTRATQHHQEYQFLTTISVFILNRSYTNILGRETDTHV